MAFASEGKSLMGHLPFASWEQWLVPQGLGEAQLKALYDRLMT